MALNFTGRPKPTGPPVEARLAINSNFFEAKWERRSDFSKFAISTVPEITEPRLRETLIRKNRRMVEASLRSTADVDLFVSGGFLYTVGPSREMAAFTITDGESEYAFELRKVNVKDLVEMEQAFNIIVRDSLEKLQYHAIGPFVYNPDAARYADIAGYPGFHVVRGYYLKCTRLPSGICLNVDIKHRILQKATVLDLVRAHKPAEVEAAVIGRWVLTTTHGMSRSYRVEAVEWKKTPAEKFTHRDTQISVADYFRNRYGVTLDARQPLLLARRSKHEEPSLLPASLCRMTGFDDKLAQDTKFMRALAERTRVSPAVRFAAYSDIMNALMSNQATARSLSRAGISIDPRPLRIQSVAAGANILRTLTDIQSVKDFSAGTKPSAGVGLNIDRIEFPHLIKKAIGFPSGSFALSVFYPDRALSGIAQDCAVRLNNMRSRLASPASLAPVPAPQMIAADGAAQIKAPDAVGTRFVAVLVLPRRGGDDIYKKFKKSCVAAGVVSQCVREQTLGDERKRDQALEKLFYQIVAKCGGMLWAQPLVVGVHPRERGGIMYVALEGVTGVVSSAVSTNKLATLYSAESATVATHELCADFLQRVVDGGISRFLGGDPQRPRAVVVLRSGVSAGQSARVFEHERLALRAVLEPAGIRLAYITLNTDIQQRFMLGDRNPPPLSVHDVSGPGRFDFYIAHQAVTQGTVTPTHYDVLEWDEGIMSLGQLYDVLRQLSMNYANWPGPIRVPAPTMYARKLQAFKKEVLGERAPIMASIATRPWYI